MRRDCSSHCTRPRVTAWLCLSAAPSSSTIAAVFGHLRMMVREPHFHFLFLRNRVREDPGLGWPSNKYTRGNVMRRFLLGAVVTSFIVVAGANVSVAQTADS